MKAGSIVECIDDDFSELAFKVLEYMPVKGNWYVVRRVVYDNHFLPVEILGLHLEEIINPKRWFWNESFGRDVLLEPGFYACRFREVQPPMKLEWLVSEEKECCLLD